MQPKKKIYRNGPAKSPEWLENALHQALLKIELLYERQPGQFLWATREGRYQPCEPVWWTSGFWPGILWRSFEISGRAEFAKAAEGADQKLAECFTDEHFYRLHHDVGFQFLLSAVEHYRLTGNLAARQRGLLAAHFLASRFVLDGRFIRAWNIAGSERLSIIDTMMNLPLLAWASQEIGDDRFLQIAQAHADTVSQRVMRPDGSVPHIVKIEPTPTGQVLEWAEGSQGYRPDSAWARGQAWAIYGFARLYLYSNESRYLQASQRVANYYLTALPEELIPPWDFMAAAKPRDSSAAAIAVAGLFYLSKSLASNEPEASTFYGNKALSLLESLNTQCASWGRADQEGLLLEGVEHYPAGRNVNTSLIYGDYYFLEALDLAFNFISSSR